MGCDIHLFTERRIGDRWHLQREEVYDGRNYDLFGILANVRNGRGFAGIKTGLGFEPIDDPRGTPKDASPEYLKELETWGADAHSHSYFTLRELLDYDWTQTTGKTGWVTLREFERWARWHRKAGYGPEEYCADVAGPQIEHISEDEADAVLKQFANDYGAREEFARSKGNTYVQIAWGTPYYRAAGSFISHSIPKLLKLAGGVKGVDDVRIVFFFDN